MNTPHTPAKALFLTLALALGATATTTARAANPWPGTAASTPPPAAATKTLPPALARNLKTFDDLDFRVYSGQQWQDLHKSHTRDVLVHWPDGHVAQGRDRHIEDLKVLWTFAPDNRIQEHPVRFGTQDAEWTAVTGWLEGTFTKPMTMPDGTTVAPTGKAYRLPMATIGHWNKDGEMFEEYLFWDNAEFMKQLGVGH